MDSSFEYFDENEDPDERSPGPVFKKEVLIMTRFYLVFLMCLLVASTADAADDWTQQSPAYNLSARYQHAMAPIPGPGGGFKTQPPERMVQVIGRYPKRLADEVGRITLERLYESTDGCDRRRSVGRAGE